MSFHSQHGEDRWCAENLSLPAKGTFVEVGAANGVENSNTLWLEERGWTGIVVEPDPRHRDALYNNRKCRVCPCACGIPAKFEGEGRDFPMMINPTHSGFARENAPGAVLTGVFSLGHLLRINAFDKLDFLSIDTEGTELDVWESLPAEMRPPVVIIEWSTEGLGVADNSAAVIARLEGDGYALRHTTDCNLIFKHL